MPVTLFRRTLPASLLLSFFLIFVPECQAESKNGFDLSHAIIPASDIHRGGPPRDGIPALTNPPVLPAARAKYLRPNDLVVGVVFNGRARAYPLRILVWHEVANDRVGGLPIAVTYCPLCNSTLVFDRRAGGLLREFGVSGLLWNSNVLMYDRAGPGRESLWSQVKMRAVTGPAARAGAKLELLPSVLTTWRDWHRRHPNTSVLSRATGHGRDYDASPYASYFRSDRLMFPVDRNDGADRSKSTAKYRNKDMFLVVGDGKLAKAYAFRDLATRGPRVRDRIREREIVIEYDARNETAVVRNDTRNSWPAAYMFWFTLRSIRPDIPIWNPDK